MSRLPIPGSDDGVWGDVLNDFLLQSHTTSGKIKPNSITSSVLASEAVDTTVIADGAVNMSKLATDVLNRLSAIESKLTYITTTRTVLGNILPSQESVTNNGNPLELAMRFSANIDGKILGIRFYKNTANTGIHTGTLRQNNGNPIKTVVFDNETSSGWQTQLFDTPVSISANTPYLVSYLSPTGNFSRSPDFFTNPLYVQDLTAPASTPENPNGMYREGAGIPDTAAFQNASYLVDVLFMPSVFDN